jgi:hypothetical protein
MPLKTETYVLGDERDRLDDRLDTLADQAAGGDEEAIDEARDVESHLAGVIWGIDQYGADAEVRVGGLTTGEMAEVRDRTAAAREESKQFGGHGQVDGAATTFYTAAGVLDAPFVDGTASVDALAPTVANELHPQFTQWLESRIDDVTSVDSGNVTPFAERLAARTADET